MIIYSVVDDTGDNTDTFNDLANEGFYNLFVSLGKTIENKCYYNAAKHLTYKIYKWWQYCGYLINQNINVWC